MYSDEIIQALNKEIDRLGVKKHDAYAAVREEQGKLDKIEREISRLELYLDTIIGEG